MNRDAIKALMDASQKVERALEALPYRDAKPAMRALDEMRDLVAEQLPGHEYAECGFCHEAKGVDEMQDCGDERMCADCCDDLQKSAA